MNNKLTDFTKVSDLFFASEENLSHNGCYVITYHNLESAVKCPRCGKSGELVEDGPIRSLYRCVNCGIFSKITKKQSPDGKTIECRLPNPCPGCKGK
ncbi:MAG: hypothetical protein ACKO90_23490, partial [Microcystis panniformis]